MNVLQRRLSRADRGRRCIVLAGWIVADDLEKFFAGLCCQSGMSAFENEYGHVVDELSSRVAEGFVNNVVDYIARGGV